MSHSQLNNGLPTTQGSNASSNSSGSNGISRKARTAREACQGRVRGTPWQSTRAHRQVEGIECGLVDHNRGVDVEREEREVYFVGVGCGEVEELAHRGLVGYLGNAGRTMSRWWESRVWWVVGRTMSSSRDGRGASD